jgi:phosphatidylglycerol:prolipoprotein diacylglycerol transferase
VPRHPSQLYQFALEGVALFVLLWLFSRKQRLPGVVSAMFLVGYGVQRVIAEVFREPEALYGAMPLGLSAGQVLSLPMIAIGLAMLIVLQRKPRS